MPVVVAPLLCACAGVDGWPAAGRSTNPVAPVAASYQGEEAVPNPANPMVGLRFTGKPCDAVVRVDDSGAARVESSFVPGRVVDLTPVADTFHLGELGGGSALVVQFDGDGALLDLTYTSYDEAGDLNYGVSEPYRVFRRLHFLGKWGSMGRPSSYSPEVQERAMPSKTPSRGCR